MSSDDRNPIGALSAFFFEGGNSTLNPMEMNLEDIPTVLISQGTDSILTHPHLPYLVSTLICDPQMHLAPATVTISDGFRLQAAVRSGPPVVKNIPVDAAKVVFSESLIVAVTSLDSYGDAILNILFLPDPFGVASFINPKPLSLDKINQNMNKMLMSSAKAYLSGYRSEGNDPTNSSFYMADTDATVEAQVLALTTSRPFLISLSVISCILAVLLSFLVIGGRVSELRTFDLENIVKILKID
jgi:hypothetical protein